MIEIKQFFNDSIKSKFNLIKNNIADILFITLVIFMLFAGLIKTLFFSKDINYYENRPAYKIEGFSISNFYNGNFQDKLELALSDQIPFAQKMKKAYNTINSYWIKNAIKHMYSDKYFYLGSYIYVFGDDEYLVYPPEYFRDTQEDADARMENINKMIKAYPDIGIFIYYIEKDSDIDFETNNKTLNSQYLIENIKVDKKNIGIFEINSFDEYKEYFYRTDHHWNYKGSYKAYCEIIEMITEDEPIEILDTICLKQRLSGSKASASGYGKLYNEDFYAYKLNLPEHKTYINGTESIYGLKENDYNNMEDEYISYGGFYGWDDGEVIFDYKDKEKENLLILGESYDNAIVELIASHFNKTYSVDLRAYEMDMGHKFEFEKYLKENNITKVLLVGNIGFYRGEMFNVEV